MHRRYPTTVLVVLAAGAVGCGEQTTAQQVATTPPGKRTVTQPHRIVLRGDYGPNTHGPIELDGRYTVRFTQQGAGVDFTREVPFTAHLERPTTVTVHGRYDVVIDFGDSPYAIVIRPAP